MQLEETASSKDVPPLSSRGVFGLPEFVAQKNKYLAACVSPKDTVCCGFLVSRCAVHLKKKLLVC